MDRTQQIIAAYGAVITILLDILVEKHVVELPEIRQRVDALIREAPALHPHGAEAIRTQLSALAAAVLLRSVPAPDSLVQ